MSNVHSLSGDLRWFESFNGPVFFGMVLRKIGNRGEDLCVCGGAESSLRQGSS